VDKIATDQRKFAVAVSSIADLGGHSLLRVIRAFGGVGLEHAPVSRRGRRGGK
jgi:hypothetical protein